ncbi:hypothetical protein SAY86_010449 [Trapa natans]|uniref:Pyrroline-5-carboxylate reductase n=1 Tax=Trapa natans TaxID=22666 RepID=A0AAN7R475_TRANT|nr:hypothetical protein SAY86_010449 [Trapa natans]
MAEEQLHQSPSPAAAVPEAPPRAYALLLSVMSKRRTWVCLFVLVYAILLSSTWNSLRSILSWYKIQSEHPSGWPALYASVMLGAVFGVLSMAAALAVVIPATLVTWIAIVVLLAFCGKPRRALVVEGRKITREIIGLVCRVLLKEGNVVAAVCAVVGYFALVKSNREAD